MKGKNLSIVVNQQAYFYLEVWSLFHLLGFLLWGSLDLIFLLVSLQPPQLLLNAPPLLPHLFSVLLIEEGKLPSAATKTHRPRWFTLGGSEVIIAWFLPCVTTMIKTFLSKSELLTIITIVLKILKYI